VRLVQSNLNSKVSRGASLLEAHLRKDHIGSTLIELNRDESNRAAGGSRGRRTICDVRELALSNVHKERGEET